MKDKVCGYVCVSVFAMKDADRLHLTDAIVTGQCELGLYNTLIK